MPPLTFVLFFAGLPYGWLFRCMVGRVGSGWAGWAGGRTGGRCSPEASPKKPRVSWKRELAGASVATMRVGLEGSSHGMEGWLPTVPFSSPLRFSGEFWFRKRYLAVAATAAPATMPNPPDAMTVGSKPASKTIAPAPATPAYSAGPRAAALWRPPTIAGPASWMATAAAWAALTPPRPLATTTSRRRVSP